MAKEETKITSLGGYDITFKQKSKNVFVIRYGKQIDEVHGILDAAHMIGSNIMHALACEGKIDSEQG